MRWWHWLRDYLAGRWSIHVDVRIRVVPADVEATDPKVELDPDPSSPSWSDEVPFGPWPAAPMLDPTEEMPGGD
jgi:hypothetical protein